MKKAMIANNSMFVTKKAITDHLTSSNDYNMLGFARDNEDTPKIESVWNGVYSMGYQRNKVTLLSMKYKAYEELKYNYNNIKEKIDYLYDNFERCFNVWKR